MSADAGAVRFDVTRGDDPALLREAAVLHHDSLSYRSFITDFGTVFLREFYRTLLLERNGFLVVATRNSRLIGFVLCCLDSSRMLSGMVKRWYAFALPVLAGLITRPATINKVFQTLRYGSGDDVKAELVVIAVSERERSKGTGGRLFELMEDEFKRAGVGAFKVSVHQGMAGANNFYRRQGMSLSRVFPLIGVEWNTYLKRLA